MKNKVLLKTDYLDLCKADDWFYYIHESRCDGQCVAIFPFMTDPFRFMLRREYNPAHADGLAPTSITGGIDPGHGAEEAALIELEEEAGVKGNIEELIPLGIMYPHKMSDTIFYLFAIDIGGKEINEAKGDGSKGESGSHCTLETDIEKIVYCKDPLNLVMLSRLKRVINLT